MRISLEGITRETNDDSMEQVLTCAVVLLMQELGVKRFNMTQDSINGIEALMQVVLSEDGEAVIIQVDPVSIGNSNRH